MKKFADQAVPVAKPGEKHQAEARHFQGIPGIAVTRGGRIFALCYGGGDGEGADNYVVMWHSDDSGSTWNRPVAVVDPPEADVRAFDATPWIAPDGKLWLFWAQGRSERLWQIFDGYAGVWCAVLENPDDAPEKFRWSEPRRIADGVMMNKPVVLSDGTWALPVSVWNLHDERQKPADSENIGTKMIVSGDGGRTFHERGRFIMPDDIAIYDEHSFVELSDGRIRCVVRTKRGNYDAWSEDGGRTWPERRESDIEGPNSRLFIRRLKSGRILLVNNLVRKDEETGALFPMREKMTAWLSDDDGATWYGGLRLDDRENVSYPDGQQADDGFIWTVHDWNRMDGCEIVVSRFTEADVAAGRLVTPGSRLGIVSCKAAGARK